MARRLADAVTAVYTLNAVHFWLGGMQHHEGK